MKQEATYESTQGIREVFKHHLDTIPENYDFSHYQNEKEDLRGYKKDMSPVADPIEKITTLSKFLAR